MRNMSVRENNTAIIVRNAKVFKHKSGKQKVI